MSDNFTEEINNLIALKTEGSYWDFKEMWNNNKTSLLHDIICMANNLTNRDAYIIFGVRDSKDEKGFSVVGIDTQSPDRKDQAELIAFLRDKKFAGGIRPEIYLHTLQYDATISLDVIVIKNTLNTPYYLSKAFQGVFNNNIYSRIGDVNTPKDTSADIDKIEYLWKKRFGIDLSPLEKVKYLLQNTKDWFPTGTDGKHSNSKYLDQWHHKQFPEFTIKYDKEVDRFDNGTIDEVESDMYWMQKLPRPLHNAYVYELKVNYHSTTLYSGLAVFADGYRFERMLWQSENISYNNHYMKYCYIEKDSLSFMLDNWLCNKHETIEKTLSSTFISSLNPWEQQPEYSKNFNPYTVVPTFENHEEHICFLEYVKINIEKLIKVIGICEDHSYTNIEYIEYLCNVGETLVCWLNDWRKNKD